MNIEVINAPSSNITLPLNQSVQQSNSGQFALMLSLLYESRVQQPAELHHLQLPVSTETTPVTSQQSAPEFNLETSQTRALLNHRQPLFQLMHSLYAERSMPVDTVPEGNAPIADDVLQEISQGHGDPQD